MKADGGQATVELVALLPLLVVVALAAGAVLAGMRGAEQAGQAAEAGAIALIRGDDARGAARAALPQGARPRVRIAVAGHRVTVTLRPRSPLPFLSRTLEATATADAGPEPPP